MHTPDQNRTSASAMAHPNVALIKYWGKRSAADNVPAVGSLSVTLGALRTETTVSFDEALDQDVLVLDGVEQPSEHPRLTACMDGLREIAGRRMYAAVESENDFPTGAGLASSASGYAALVTAGAAALGIDANDPRLLDVARVGSGSAPRSLFGGMAVLRHEGAGTVCEQLIGPDDWALSVVVAVTTEAPKSTSSRDGMEQSRLTSPYYEPWVATHAPDLDQAIDYVERREFAGLAELAEHNCLKMHAVMMTTRPALLYWSPTTLAVMHEVVALRGAGVPVFFTIDAGPQVKAVCPTAAVADVESRLAQVPGVLRTISGELGYGARVVAC
ncbi:MAG: diphosphomevalonate decarboxylase [Gammaproteobacteria bacterium]